MTRTVRFEPWGTAVEVEEGRTLLDAARAASIPLGAVCGGRGTCGKCRVRIREGSPAPASAAEQAALHPGSVERGERLACRTVVAGPLTVEAFLPHSAGKAASPPLPPSFAPDPPVLRRAVRVQAPALDRALSDADNLLESLADDSLCMDYGAMRDLPVVLRAAGWDVTASIRGNQLIAVRPRATAREPLGLAVDLGTTSIAASLYRMDTASLVGEWSVMNPLSLHGADIISRMTWALAAPGNGERMQQVLAKALTEIARRAAGEAGASAGDIEEMVVVGNSGMHHLLLDLPGRALMNAPFVPVVSSALSLKARDLGIGICPGASVYLPPLVGGFIGSDLLGVALATRLDSAKGVRLALDIGTNTEILLCVDGSLTACSTASGPALEGAALRFGSLAVPGAIDVVRPGADGIRLDCRTIGNSPPAGICGSGIIDLLACLRATGTVDARGRLSARARGVVPDPGGDHSYVIVPAGDTALGVDLTVSQAEIRQLQLAKGAIRAGIDTLLSLQGIDVEKVVEILIAGDFGSHLDTDNALRIGLLPPVDPRRVRRIGNAAGTGAAMMLLSNAERSHAVTLARAIRHIELAREPGFLRRFARAQWFPQPGMAEGGGATDGGSRPEQPATGEKP